jgi:preprotein translocase subunit YajC
MWIITCVLSLGAGIHQTFREGIGKSYVFFIISVVAFAFYYFRRKLRKQEKK